MSGDALGAQDLTRRLIGREASAANSPAAPAAVHAACERVHHALSHWLGASGCDALFARALVIARAEHAMLEGVRLGKQSTPSEPALNGVNDLVRTYGSGPVATALESLLVALLELLGRLVGDDLLGRLVREPDPGWDAERIRMQGELEQSE